jgi:hypothetical protein
MRRLRRSENGDFVPCAKPMATICRRLPSRVCLADGRLTGALPTGASYAGGDWPFVMSETSAGVFRQHWTQQRGSDDGRPQAGVAVPSKVTDIVRRDDYLIAGLPDCGSTSCDEHVGIERLG